MKKKMSLQEIRVDSFVTSLSDAATVRLKGGAKPKIPTLDGCFTNNTTNNNICETTK